MLLQQTEQFPEDFVLFQVQVTHHHMAFLHLLQRCASIDGGCAYTRGDLLFQAADAFHEELVEIVAHDGEEFDAFQQWCLLIPGHIQDPAIELQPRQFPVEVQLGLIETHLPGL